MIYDFLQFRAKCPFTKHEKTQPIISDEALANFKWCCSENSTGLDGMLAFAVGTYSRNFFPLQSPGDRVWSRLPDAKEVLLFFSLIVSGLFNERRTGSWAILSSCSRKVPRNLRTVGKLSSCFTVCGYFPTPLSGEPTRKLPEQC